MFLSILFAVFPLILRAAPPTRPVPGVDSELRRTLEDRLKDDGSQAQVRTAVANYRARRDELIQMRRDFKPASQIDALSESMVWKERETELLLMQSNGPCAAREVSYVREEDEENVNGDTIRVVRHWYTSDGSCVWKAPSDEKLTAVYEKVTRLVSTASFYPKRNDGFNWVLEFLRVDEKGNALSSELQKTPVLGNAFNAFTAVASPVANFSISYYLRARISPGAESGDRQWDLQFDSLKAQPMMRHSVYYGASGSTQLTVQNLLKLRQTNGGWSIFLDSKNQQLILRYFTQGDFQAPLLGAQDFARRVLLDTLVSLYERAIEE